MTKAGDNKNDTDNTSLISSNIHQSQSRKEHHEISIEEPSSRTTGSNTLFSFRSMSNCWKKKHASSPRLVPRSLPFHQSKNTVSIQNTYGKHLRRALWKLYQHDWFHVFLRLPTPLSIVVLLSIWTLELLIFALIYVAVDSHDTTVDCGLWPVTGQPITFYGAFAFALETSTTVGYTLPGRLHYFVWLLAANLATYTLRPLLIPIRSHENFNFCLV